MQNYNKNQNTVEIPIARYEQLLKAESLLNAVCRFLSFKKSYELESIRPIVGDYLPPFEKEEAEI